MANMHIANAFKPVLLDLERTTLNGYYFGLFVSNTTVTDATLIGALTECSDSGYTGTGRQHPAFTTASLNGSNQGELDAPDLTWTFSHGSGDFTVFGWFLATLSSGGALVLSGNVTPFTVTAAGQTYTISPKKLMDTM